MRRFDERITAIKKRLDAISEGPWVCDEQSCADWLGGGDWITYTRLHIETPNGNIATVEGTSLRSEYEFMAAARQDVPWLLEQIEALLLTIR